MDVPYTTLVQGLEFLKINVDNYVYTGEAQQI